MQPDNPLRVIVAGGGTGGHIFPAIAIASAIAAKRPDARILFVGARGRMEMQKVPEAGFHILGLPVAGIRRQLTWKNLRVPGKLFQSLMGARKIVKRFRPHVVVGVGGYASAPVAWAATRQKVPVLIQEQNSYPGLTNRLLAKKAGKICVAYEGMEKYFPAEKIFLTGNPVRKQVVDIQGKRTAALAHFGLSPDRPVVLITGGSLGAATINRAMQAHLPLLVEKGIQVLWQCGSFYEEKAKRHAEPLKNRGVKALAFIARMDYAYAAADVVVSRAGAIAVSEIAAVQKPAILIPSPNVAEDHQTKNAMALVNHHAAILVKDSEAVEKLGEVLTDLVFDEHKKHRLKEKIAGMAKLNATDAIAQMAVDMALTSK